MPPDRRRDFRQVVVEPALFAIDNFHHPRPSAPATCQAHSRLGAAEAASLQGVAHLQVETDRVFGLAG